MDKLGEHSPQAKQATKFLTLLKRKLASLINTNHAEKGVKRIPDTLTNTHTRTQHGQIPLLQTQNESASAHYWNWLVCQVLRGMRPDASNPRTCQYFAVVMTPCGALPSLHSCRGELHCPREQRLRTVARNGSSRGIKRWRRDTQRAGYHSRR